MGSPFPLQGDPPEAIPDISPCMPSTKTWVQGLGLHCLRGWKTVVFILGGVCLAMLEMIHMEEEKQNIGDQYNYLWHLSFTRTFTVLFWFSFLLSSLDPMRGQGSEMEVKSRQITIRWELPGHNGTT